MTLPLRRVGLCTVTLSVLGLGACSNPFASNHTDYAPPISLERFRQIDATEFVRAPIEAANVDPAISAAKRFEGMESVDLLLQECRVFALEGNLNLKVTLINPTIANQNLSVEEAAFDATFTITSLWSSTDTPTASTLHASGARHV